MLLCAWDVLKKVDYWLLATFVCFFIFAGNIGRSGGQELLEARCSRTPCWVRCCPARSSATCRQRCCSPTSPPTQRDAAGTNIGGLGTLVASLASLISFKQYIRTPGAKPLRYLGLFTAANVVMLVVLYIFAAICL